MTKLPVVRCVIAAVLGLAAGGVAWSRVAPLPHFLDLKATRGEEPGTWELFVTARGGDPFDEIDVGPATGSLQVLGPTSVRNLESGSTRTFRLRLDDGVRRAAVRVNVPAPDMRTYDFTVGEEP
jgi:hypothetical protein